MSDTDANDAGAGDDSGFDKEAEREKLREKYEQDREKRESTQRMSELLLQGATMTNKHCDACGDPIFRQNGEEFCATCDQPGQGGQQPADGQAAGEQAGQQQPAQAGQQQSAQTGQQSAGQQPAQAGQQSGGRGTGAERQPNSAPTQPGARGDDAARRPAEPRQAATRSVDVGASTRGDAADSARTGGDAGSLDGARDALVTALQRHAQAGADASDPRTASEHLDAAREAAEALSALRR
ncbi:Sjogren's syndrome/scleroderma autoantigen 1 family protein [Halobaculum sp. P14]|uniref:Sjogren's syndrome/scleroderma autoantigen 1 family protein n=1 Tax=Halobaculum sp. P14 TaxID=3421638 RepID=UPI003EB75ED1